MLIISVQELSQPKEDGNIYKFCGGRKQHVHGGLLCMRVQNTLKADSSHMFKNCPSPKRVVTFISFVVVGNSMSMEAYCA